MTRIPAYYIARVKRLRERPDWRGLMVRRSDGGFIIEALRVNDDDTISGAVISWEREEREAFRSFREALRAIGCRDRMQGLDKPARWTLSTREVNRIRDLSINGPRRWIEGLDERLYWSGWISTSGDAVFAGEHALDTLFDSAGRIRETFTEPAVA